MMDKVDGLIRCIKTQVAEFNNSPVEQAREIKRWIRTAEAALTLVQDSRLEQAIEELYAQYACLDLALAA